jgi:hypothetical protein
MMLPPHRHQGKESYANSQLALRRLLSTDLACKLMESGISLLSTVVLLRQWRRARVFAPHLLLTFAALCQVKHLGLRIVRHGFESYIIDVSGLMEPDEDTPSGVQGAEKNVTTAKARAKQRHSSAIEF